jgi:hypothetical protein
MKAMCRCDWDAIELGSLAQSDHSALINAYEIKMVQTSLSQEVIMQLRS